MVCSTDRSKAVVPVLVLLFVALWFILRGDLLYVFQCVILFLCFSVLLVLRLPRLGKRELILVPFVRFVRFVPCLDLSVSSSSWGLGRAAVCDCGTPWTFLLPFLKTLFIPESERPLRPGHLRDYCNVLKIWMDWFYYVRMPIHAVRMTGSGNPDPNCSCDLSLHRTPWLVCPKTWIK